VAFYWAEEDELGEATEFVLVIFKKQLYLRRIRIKLSD